MGEITELIKTVITPAAGALVAYIMARVHGEMSALRLEIEKARQRDREELRAWINGSFMRAAVVEAKLTEIDRRLIELEDNIE